VSFVSIHDLYAAMAGEVTVIDVREPVEFVAGHVPGARLVPLATVPQVLDDLPPDEPVYVICAVGQRSAYAADYLSQRGIDARSVDGGTVDWAAAGYPLER
jgi:rhodanese-related sulfurtransferase